MDPDMVRQQEEEETASRQRGPVPPRPGIVVKPSGREEAFVLRAEPREGDRPSAATASETRARAQKPPPGWGAALRASFFATAVASLVLVAGIMAGVRLGLVAWQSLAIGLAGGYLLGWQAAVSGLRRRYELSFGKALRATAVPVILILLALVSAMATAALFIDISPEALSNGFLPSYWMTVAGGAFAGFLLAVVKMRNNLKR